MTFSPPSPPTPADVADLLTTIGEAFYTLDAAWRFTFVNHEAARMLEQFLGKDGSDLIGKSLWDEFPEAADTRLYREYHRAVAEQTPVVFEECFPPARRWYEMHAYPFKDGLSVFSRDITDRKRAEEQQRGKAEEELRRWAHVFEHASWGVAIGSPGGERIEAVNPAFARMHGYTPAELIGRPISSLYPREAAPALRAHVQATIDQGHHAFESVHLRKDGSTFPILVEATAIPGAGGEVRYLATNVQDLTERRRAEEQLRQAQKMEAVGRLAGGVAHDFNNMLMIIIGFTDFLLVSTEATDPRHEDITEIRKAAERAANLTRQLLAFGRRQLRQTEVVNLNEVVRDMERMLRPLLGEDIRLLTNLSAGLGGTAADRGQLEQVIMNLALNARDAMVGGGQLTIETMSVLLPEGYAYRHIGIDIPAGAYVMLVVSDTGVGMDADVKARIFEPFFTTKPPSQNTGLGLTTVYGIVAQNGGHIWVNSMPGWGASFTVCFPRAGPPDAAVDDPALLRPIGGTETVLVVEDEPAVRSLACRVLAAQGYRVLEAPNGRAALDVIAQQSDTISLVVTDVVMPEMGGRELGEQMERLLPSARVLYISGYTDSDILRRGLSGAATSFLQKPFSPDSLAHKVREVLDLAPPPIRD